jgi:hypothetical protein
MTKTAKKECNHKWVKTFNRVWNDDHTFTDTDYELCTKCKAERNVVEGEKNPERGYGAY